MHMSIPITYSFKPENLEQEIQHEFWIIEKEVASKLQKMQKLENLKISQVNILLEKNEHLGKNTLSAKITVYFEKQSPFVYQIEGHSNHLGIVKKVLNEALDYVRSQHDKLKDRVSEVDETEIRKGLEDNL